MAHRKPPEPTENGDKAEENGDATPTLQRFKNLTKRVLNVSRDELADAQRRYDNDRTKKPDN